MSVSIPSFIKNFNQDKFMEIVESNEFNFNNIFKYFIFSYNANKMPNNKKDLVSKIIDINFAKIWRKLDNLKVYYSSIDMEYEDVDWTDLFIMNATNFINIELCNYEKNGTFYAEHEINKDIAIEKMKNWLIQNIYYDMFADEFDDLEADTWNCNTKRQAVSDLVNLCTEFANVFMKLFHFFYKSNAFNNVDDIVYKRINAKYIIYNVASKAYWNTHTKIGKKMFWNRLHKEGLDNIIKNECKSDRCEGDYPCSVDECVYQFE